MIVWHVNYDCNRTNGQEITWYVNYNCLIVPEVPKSLEYQKNKNQEYQKNKNSIPRNQEFNTKNQDSGPRAAGPRRRGGVGGRDHDGMYVYM